MCAVNITSGSITRLNDKFSLQAFLTLCSKPDLCTRAWKRCVPSEGFLHLISPNQTCRTFSWAGNPLHLPTVSQVTVAPCLDWALGLWDDVFIIWVSFHSAVNVVTTRNTLFFLCHSVLFWLTIPLRPLCAISQKFPVHILTSKIFKTWKETSFNYFSYKHIR